MSRKILRWGTALAASLLTAGIIATARAESVKIAVVGPMSGNYAQYGAYLRNGVELAAKAINASGAAGSYTIEVVAEDDQMDPKQAATVAQRLVSANDILAVVGHFSSTTSLAAQPIYQRAGIPMISPSSTSPDLANKANFYRTAVTDDVVSTQLADYAVKTKGFKRIAILYQTGTSTIAQGEIFAKRAKELGAEIVLMEGHEPERVDFQAVVTKLVPLKPDLVFVPTFTAEASKIARQLREAGITAPLMGTDALFDPQFIELAGAAGDGTYAAAFFDENSTRPSAKAFVDAYKAAYGQAPEGYGANAYDAALLIAAAVKAAGPDRAKLLDYLGSLGNAQPAFPGVTGDIGFGADHNVHKNILVVELKGGKFQPAQ
ncbi:MAG: ABC transporter substrate-binding protein [Dongiaceae bacterium]